MDCKIAKFAFSVVKEQAIGDNKVVLNITTYGERIANIIARRADAVVSHKEIGPIGRKS